jgi:SAM-dependent methyltransferase
MNHDPEIETEQEHWNDRWRRENRREGPALFLVMTMDYLPESGLALDIACGTGENDVLLASRYRVKAIDFSEVAIQYATELLAKEQMLDRVDLVQADVMELLPSEPDAAYDVVTCFNFFDPAIVPHVKRVLSPVGWLVLQTYTANDERTRTSRFGDRAINAATLLDPDYFGGYEIKVHEVEEYADPRGRIRQRVNFLARKPGDCKLGRE